MKESIITVGSLWYTAWINAGQPPLDELMKPISNNYKKELETNHKKSLSNKSLEENTASNYFFFLLFLDFFPALVIGALFT